MSEEEDYIPYKGMPSTQLATMLHKSQLRVNALVSRNKELEKEVQKLEIMVAQLKAQPEHFQRLLDGVNSNPLAKHHWDKMMMCLRLCENEDD